MCNWCHAILKRESRYTSKVLDLSINLYFRLVLEDHFNLQQLAWLRTTIHDDQCLPHLSRLLPTELVNSQVWQLLQYRYPSIVREAIKTTYDAKRKRQKITMELICLRARSASYLIGNGASKMPNKLNHYQI